MALDAQKAFDSVQHSYIRQVLDQVGLGQFNPIFRLLYKDLRNDIIINGKIGPVYALGNGVKQGDALSCSLFLQAMEPLIRNIENNIHIQAISSPHIDYRWPKVLGYADDITVITANTHECVNEIFHEYQRLTQASGLQLNAEKTEKFNITGSLCNEAFQHSYVTYYGNGYAIAAQSNIKINGVFFDTNLQRMATQNYDHMCGKMCRHFTEWSKRSLSLLGKIQIIKTFGLSQYLYSLAVIDLTEKQWGEVQKLLYKFLWNKNFHGWAAPHRIKMEIMTTPRELGGFGMVNLRDIVSASRLRRFAQLRKLKHHPVERLQEALGGYEYLRPLPKHPLDSVSTTVMQVITRNIWSNQLNMMPGMAETDLLLHSQLLHSKLRWLIRSDRVRSIEYNILRARGRHQLKDVVPNAAEVTMLARIVPPKIREMIHLLATEYNGAQVPDAMVETKVYDAGLATWLDLSNVGSSISRKFLNHKHCITNFKLINLDEDVALRLLSRVNKIISIPNRTKFLRLLHGDVYCATRLVQFGLSTIDRCG